MHPVICKIGPFTVFSYGLALAVAFVTASLLAALQARRRGISFDSILNLCFAVFIFGIIGGRVFHILGSFGDYVDNPLEIFMLQHGGLSWFGGLFAGTLGGLYYIRKTGLPLYETLDLISPFAALGHAIGRIGCFLNGCCYGKVSEHFGLYSESQGAMVIPTQIYSSIILVVLFVFLRFIQDRRHTPGQVFALYLIFDSVQRFIIEFWRGDHSPFFAGLTAFQIFSIIAFCIGAVLYRAVSAKR